jgi:deoxyhypusine synthase
MQQTSADMYLAGKELRAKGLNRIGNMLVPNSNYCLFEDWIMPLLDQMLKEQQDQGTVWTPSKVRKHQTECLICWQPATMAPVASLCAYQQASIK